jgi:hypothetical protein
MEGKLAKKKEHERDRRAQMAKQVPFSEESPRAMSGKRAGGAINETKKKNLVQFAVTDNLKDLLDDLKDRTGRESLSAVVRDAITVYAWIVEQYEQGKEVLPKSQWRVERRFFPVQIGSYNAVNARRGGG